MIHYRLHYLPAGVVKLVDTPDLGSGAFGRVSSSLIRRTLHMAAGGQGDCPRRRNAAVSVYGIHLKTIYNISK